MACIETKFILGGKKEESTRSILTLAETEGCKEGLSLATGVGFGEVVGLLLIEGDDVGLLEMVGLLDIVGAAVPW